MSCREHQLRVYDAPRVYTEEVSATGEGDNVFMTQIIDFDDFRTAVVHLKLKPDDEADANNIPTSLRVWALEADGSTGDPDESTRVLVHEKCLDGIAGWSGYMFLEVSETHVAQYLGQSISGDFQYLQFSMSGPNGVDYDMVVVMMDPRNKEGVLLEANT